MFMGMIKYQRWEMVVFKRNNKGKKFWKLAV